MSDQELFYLLALLKVDGVGDIMAKKLLVNCSKAEDVFKTKTNQLAAIDGVGSVLLKNLKDKSIFEKANQELEFIRKNNITVSYFQEENYPDRLKHCLDSPVLLFSGGNINLKNKKIISIVGTRQITSYGIEFCRKLIEDLIPLDPVIVSGFAYGVDIVAHQFAMDYNLQTIGVLAHGLNQVYPKTHKKYMAKMEGNGGFITEFWSSSNPDKENFVKRNRIVAGISEATIVIESADKGGSLITANLANDYNRDVFAVPGRVTDRYSQGCNDLIKTQKANVLTSAADLIYVLNWDLEKKPKVIQQQLFIDLNPDEQKIYDFLLKNGKELLDIIALECDLPIFKISGTLLNMELKGIIRPLPGKMFEVV
ncbi:DNA-processing protein DprA [Flavobacterium johnsoniae]|uniref:DNA protecting protein DprA n=1 Tax=Flavobacterium johnsoniae (strain ATCC 17061 / DSM 2064 / JCM 8514 / BCRC 14874 / CCUG 350202 / NBRC 14942 / NCIMB 11054 / UW101) TaxID=376686 RepID=A5FL93_FLAJ1|nr:DNA-processing protein DprA [Flavobacterium johnsoniae]ABQ04028.1 DNA protecting protein DprA [Flavobacterium johnsoniae UW101]OXE95432.1 DNA-processing protein DprA [Flavobacterium johnsoniae UW101]WQG79101.1 DNA-processing protein DprA [Flavobacterium johnsoniae UW101]SHK10260.1 DNA processing protein [Flavobacterium johnsoniae]